MKIFRNFIVVLYLLFFHLILHDDEDGNFIGEISDPIPINFDKDDLMNLNF